MNTPKRGYQRTTNIKEIIERKGKQRGQRDTKTEEKIEEIALISPFRIFFFFIYVQHPDNTHAVGQREQPVCHSTNSVSQSVQFNPDRYIYMYISLRFFYHVLKFLFLFKSSLLSFFLVSSSLLSLASPSSLIPLSPPLHSSSFTSLPLLPPHTFSLFSLFFSHLHLHSKSFYSYSHSSTPTLTLTLSSPNL
ncbi:hypothetical protein BKA57DRAFT_12852 [Linnemannia elongata]|nr:hypothetical protein BKA57DRAFT_12852 [Linnemannia elongata]